MYSYKVLAHPIVISHFNQHSQKKVGATINHCSICGKTQTVMNVACCSSNHCSSRAVMGAMCKEDWPDPDCGNWRENNSFIHQTLSFANAIWCCSIFPATTSNLGRAIVCGFGSHWFICFLAYGKRQPVVRLFTSHTSALRRCLTFKSECFFFVFFSRTNWLFMA